MVDPRWVTQSMVMVRGDAVSRLGQYGAVLLRDAAGGFLGFGRPVQSADAVFSYPCVAVPVETVVDKGDDITIGDELYAHHIPHLSIAARVRVSNMA